MGVDDWAWKKGQNYGTILVDLERRTVADLLPERSAQQVENWFKQHPGVEIISRDRFGLYAKAAQRGAPQAQQVADRFHLLLICRRPSNTNSAGSAAYCSMLILLRHRCECAVADSPSAAAECRTSGAIPRCCIGAPGAPAGSVRKGSWPTPRGKECQSDCSRDRHQS